MGSQRVTPWFRPSVSKEIRSSLKSALIIGAGFAGCYLARELAERGWQVQLMEAAPAIASGASAYQQAVLFSGFYSTSSPLADLMCRGNAYTKGCLASWEKQTQAVERFGLLYFPPRPKKSCHPTQDVRWINSKHASELAGISILEDGWYFPEAACVNLPKLCHGLISHPQIDVRLEQRIASLDYKNGWQVGDKHAPVLILANGFQAKQFSQTHFLPLQAVRGQITWIDASSSSASLRLPICRDVHVLPMRAGRHAVGATFDPGHIDRGVTSHDNKKNLSKLNALKTDVQWSSQVGQAWVGLRTITGDYFPCVGQVAKETAFMEQYAPLKTDAKRWIPQTAESHPGLYVFTGFGSKGLTTIPLLARALAEEIHCGVSTLSSDELRCLSPNRFLFRNLVRSSFPSNHHRLY